MAKRYSRKIVRKKTYKLSPKESSEIIKQEIIDSRGNRHQLNFKFKPHLPNKEGDMQLRYKQGEYDDNNMGY